MTKDITDGPGVTSTKIAASTAISADVTENINSEQNVNTRQYLNNLEGPEKQQSSNLTVQEKSKMKENINLKLSLTMQAVNAFGEATYKKIDEFIHPA